MSEQTELLRLISKNAEMGELALPLVIGMVSRPDLRRALSACLVEYRAVGAQAREALRRRGRQAAHGSAAARAMLVTALRWNALRCPPPRRVAELMIRGSAMGAIQMGKRINAYRFTADGETLALAERLRRAEENTGRRMQEFL